MESFEAIIIGAGQAGVPLAKKLAEAGWKTLLVEKRLVGGTCINDGCTPTKTLIASARLAYLAGRSKDLGIDISHYSINFEAMIARKDAVVSQFRAGAIAGIEETENLQLKYGEAKFTANNEIELKDKSGHTEAFSAKYIFINTGTSPSIPDTEGLKEINYLTSTSILELKEVPEALLIVGGGYIGLEFAQMFRRFGAQVTILERGDRLMPKEDEDVCEVMSKIFEEDGISVLINTKAVKFENYGTDKIRVTVEGPGLQKTYSCSHVLMAAGRKPQTDQLGIDKTDIVCDERGHIKVNEYLETTVKNVYALGDVKGGPEFTHISYNDHLVVAANLLQQNNQSIKGRIIPYCMFTDPQLGRVGITETEAEQQGLDYLVAKIPMNNVARAIETGETRGFMKAVVDKNTKQVLGATIIGEEGGEVMSVLQMAMMGGITYDTIRHAIFAHPLYAESLNNLFMSLDD
jgi:dihydrolipoamide dehydrogenase